MKGHLGLVESLLNHFAIVTHVSGNRSALQIACEEQQETIAKRLLQEEEFKYCSFKFTFSSLSSSYEILNKAILKDNINIATVLARKLAPFNPTYSDQKDKLVIPPSFLAARKGNLQILNKLISSGETGHKTYHGDNNIFHEAIRSGDEKIFSYLAKVVPVELLDDSVFSFAIEHDNYDMLALVVSTYKEKEITYSFSPLVKAIELKNYILVKTLLKFMDPKEVDFIAAIKSQELDLLKTLVQYKRGFNLSKIFREAFLTQNVEIIEYLQSIGCDENCSRHFYLLGKEAARQLVETMVAVEGDTPKIRAVLNNRGYERLINSLNFAIVQKVWLFRKKYITRLVPQLTDCSEIISEYTQDENWPYGLSAKSFPRDYSSSKHDILGKIKLLEDYHDDKQTLVNPQDNIPQIEEVEETSAMENSQPFHNNNNNNNNNKDGCGCSAKCIVQ